MGDGARISHKAHLLKLIWFFWINHFSALIRFRSLEKVDSHSIANVFIAFEEEQTFGIPYSTISCAITLPISLGSKYLLGAKFQGH